MSALGSLVVKLALEYAQFSKGLDDSEQDVKKHAKSVQDAYDRMAGGIESRVTSLRNTVVGALAGAISVAGMVSAIGRVRTETIAAEQEQKQLAAALQSTGQAAGWSQEQLNAMADSLAKSSNFSAGELNQAQARLLSYSGIVGQTFPRAMQAVADMSARMGTSVTASAESIGRALDIPSAGLTALTQQGFRFTDAQKNMVVQLERTGRVAEAQAIILQALEGSYGGAAAAARDSLGGALTAVSETINGLLTADSASVPELRDSIEGLNDTLSSEAVRTAVQSLVGGIANLGSFAATTAAQVINLGTAVAEHSGAISVMVGLIAGPVTLLGIAKVVGSLALIPAAIGKITAAWAALTAVMAANPAGLVLVGLGAVAGVAIATNLGDPVGDRISTELANQEERLRKAEALLERAGGPKGQMTEKLEARIAGIRSHIEQLKAASGVTTPAVEAVAQSVADLGSATGALNEPIAQSDEWIRRFGTTTQKAALEVEEWKRKLGAGFTPAMQAEVEAYWAKQDAGAKTGAQSAKQLAQAYSTLKDSIAEKATALQQELLSGEKLTEAEKLRIKYAQDLKGSLGGLNAVKRQSIEGDITALGVLEKEVEARKALALAVEEERKHRQEWWATQAKTVEELQASNKQLRDEIALIGLSEKQQALVNRQRQESILLIQEQQLAQMVLAEDAVGFMSRQRIALEQEIDARRELLGLLDQKTARDAAASAAQETLKVWDKTSQTVGQTLSDYIMGGGKDAAQYLKRLFSTLVLQPVVQTVVGSVLGMGGSAAAAATGAAGQASSLLSGAQNLSSLYSAFTGGITSTMATGIASLGTAFGSSAITSFAAGMKGASLAAGLAGPTTAGATGAMGLGATFAAALPWVAGGMAILSLAGGLKGIFGGKVTKRDEGMDGFLGGDVRSYANFKRDGGWFGSNSYWTQYGSMAGNAQLQSTFDLLKQGVAQQADALNLSADSVTTYVHRIRFSTKGLSGDQIVQRLEEEMNAAGDAMAALVLGSTKYALAGEAASGTLSRLSTSLATVNTVLEAMGGKLFNVGLVGADMASKLVQNFGSVDAYLSVSDAYYKAYYTQAERAGKSTQSMAKQLQTLGLTLPTSQEGFRRLVSSLDLTTAHGRDAYAVLLGMAPLFDETARQLSEVAQTAAADLIATYTRAAAVAPGMQIAREAMAAATSQAQAMGGQLSSIHKLLGDASSGVLIFGTQVQATTSSLDPAQLAVLGLRSQILDLQTAASGTVIDMAGLSAALQNVDTRTFVATMNSAMELIAQRLRDELSTIAGERVAVREAVIGILGAQAMTPAQIRAQIAAQTVALPGQAGIASAQAALAKADALVAQREKEALKAQAASAGTGGTATAKAQALENSRGDAARDLVAVYLRHENVRQGLQGEVVPSSIAQLAVYNDTQANMLAKLQSLPTAQIQSFADHLAGLSTSGLGSKYGSTATYLKELADYQAAIANESSSLEKAATLRAQAATLSAKATTAEQALAAARAAQSTATGNAQKAQLDYVAALQKYSLDSSKAVTSLGKLREETVAWYQSQQAIAQTMSNSASGLRQTVADIRFNQMDTASQYASLQERFNVAYSMAMSTTGEVLAGYGSEMNQLLGPLLQKSQEAGVSSSEYSRLVATLLARADTVADRIEINTPADYQEESLGLLGQIDSTLAALELGAKSTEQLLVEAIKSGSDTTRDGLRAVIATLQGKAVPAFANGGLHAGGLRMVGERGRELEVTGPARYWSAEQTERMVSAGRRPMLLQQAPLDLQPLIDEVGRLRQEVAGMRGEQRATGGAIATNTGRTQRAVDRVIEEGMPVRNADGEQLQVVSVIEEGGS